MLSAIILVGGKATRIGREKGLVLLTSKPMIMHVIEKLEVIADEIILVASSSEQAKHYEDLGLRTVVESSPLGSPLSGALTGFKNAKGEYSFLTGSDMPLINPEAVRLLQSEVKGHDAATYIWPNGYIEPLLAVYQTSNSVQQAESLLLKGERRLGLILRNLRDVIYVPIERLREIDPDLNSLIDINTAEDLRKAELILRGKKVS